MKPPKGNKLKKQCDDAYLRYLADLIFRLKLQTLDQNLRNIQKLSEK